MGYDSLNSEFSLVGEGGSTEMSCGPFQAPFQVVLWYTELCSHKPSLDS